MSSTGASTENNPNSSTASSESDNLVNDGVPDIPSGNLEVVNASFAVERSDNEGSQDRETARFIKIEVENKSEQVIDSFRFNLLFYDDQGKQRGSRSGARGFDSPLEPGVTQDVDIELRPNTEVNELVVEILSTRSNGRTDSIPTVRKFILGQ